MLSRTRHNEVLTSFHINDISYPVSALLDEILALGLLNRLRPSFAVKPGASFCAIPNGWECTVNTACDPNCSPPSTCRRFENELLLNVPLAARL